MPRYKFPVIVLLLVSSVGCQRLATSKLQNIFLEDASGTSSGNDRRHQANLDESVWTVQARGCSGTLLSPDYVLIATHCQTTVGERMRTGTSTYSDQSRDLIVKAISERSTELDYTIAQVSWTKPIPSSQLFPPLVATSADEVFASEQAGQGDELFTVGFPADKQNTWSVTYAAGQAKTTKSNQLNFDIGVINGNSGGGVFKKENLMLVAIAIGGSKKYGEVGWELNDRSNINNWNFGTPLWEIYRSSALLKKLYPDGKRSDLGASFVPKTELHVAVEESLQPKIWVSANHETEQLYLCLDSTPSCDRNSPQAEALQFEEQRADRKFFKSPQELKQSSVVYSLQAYDKAGKLIGERRIQVSKRGGS